MSSSHARWKPLTRLGILATLSPWERAVGEVLYKNRGNEARKLLKTKDGGCCKVQKRTQKEHVFEHKVPQSSCNSGRAADRKYGGPRYENRRNKARMYMKTKEEPKSRGVKESRS